MSSALHHFSSPSDGSVPTAQWLALEKSAECDLETQVRKMSMTSAASDLTNVAGAVACICRWHPTGMLLELEDCTEHTAEGRKHQSYPEVRTPVAAVLDFRVKTLARE